MDPSHLHFYPLFGVRTWMGSHHLHAARWISNLELIGLWFQIWQLKHFPSFHNKKNNVLQSLIIFQLLGRQLIFSSQGIRLFVHVLNIYIKLRIFIYHSFFLFVFMITKYLLYNSLFLYAHPLFDASFLSVSICNFLFPIHFHIISVF